MVKYMQLVFPLVAQVQAEVIEKHGFYGERGAFSVSVTTCGVTLLSVGSGVARALAIGVEISYGKAPWSSALPPP